MPNRLSKGKVLVGALVGDIQASAGSIGTTELADDAVTSLKIDDQIAQVSADVTVSSAEILALNATPKELVAAPGAGLALVFEGAVMFLDFNSAAYAGIATGEDLSIKYTNASGDEVSQIEATGFLDATADALRYALPATTAAITPVANAALVLHLLVGEITTGDSPLKVRVYYRVIPTTL